MDHRSLGGSRSIPSGLAKYPGAWPAVPLWPYCQTTRFVRGSTTMMRWLASSVKKMSPLGSGSASEGWLSAAAPVGRYLQTTSPLAAEDDDLAWRAVVHGEVPVCGDLVRVRGIGDPRWVGAPRDGPVKGHGVDRVPIDLGDQKVPVAHRKHPVEASEVCRWLVVAGPGGPQLRRGPDAPGRIKRSRQLRMSGINSRPSGRIIASSGLDSCRRGFPGSHTGRRCGGWRCR